MEFLPTGVTMLEQIMAEQRKASGNDFYNKLIHAEAQGQWLTKAEIISTVALMIPAGSEPPRHLILFAIYDLLRYPDQLELLHREPELLRNAIHEVGRSTASAS